MGHSNDDGFAICHISAGIGYCYCVVGSGPWFSQYRYVHTGDSEFTLQLFRCNTVKPLLGGPPMKRAPSIIQTLSRVLKLTSYISLYNKPLFSGHLYWANADTKIIKLYLANFYHKQTLDWIDNSGIGLCHWNMDWSPLMFLHLQTN